MIVCIVALSASLLTGFIVWILMRSAMLAKVEEQKTGKINITFEDIIRLVNTNNAGEVNSLITYYKVNVHMPEFYEEIQGHYKRTRDAFYSELIEMMGKDRKESVQTIYNEYPIFSTQDILLLLMCEKHLDNKTMARLMGSNMDTLKKRKMRLKHKIATSGLEVTFEKKKGG